MKNIKSVKKKFLAVLLTTVLCIGIIFPLSVSAKSIIAVKSIGLSKSSIILTVGGTYILKTIINPTNATIKTVKWSTSNKNIATVNSGKITGVSAGNCVITAKSNNGKLVNCKVTVTGDSSTTNTNTNSSQQSWSDGEYLVGKDIQSGTYVAICDSNYSGYFSINSDDSNSLNSIIANDNFSGRDYLTVSSGQYLTITRAKLYAITNAPKVDLSNGTLSDGMYLVGTDIPSGQYTIVSTNSSFDAYYAITSDCSHDLTSIISNDNFMGNRYVTVTNGEYLTVTRAKFTVDDSWTPSSTTTTSTGNTSNNSSGSSTLSDSNFQTYLNTNYGSLTTDNKTIPFNWKINNFSINGYDEIIDTSIDSTEYLNWLYSVKDGDSSDMNSFVNNIVTTIHNNYPNKTFVGDIYFQGYFSTYPSGFDASEISWSSSKGEWLVTHVVVGFYSTDGSTTHYTIDN